ncbi:hypothetical protein BSPWISOXPB_4752 [uncultured Gammaproteobacteria bacterium]|nr:hypothetical protein BSPWISOXPB_4752 [uncultured Gammaproteobacteria bacterium]
MGDSSYGGAGAPSGGGYTKIYSTGGAFVAVKADGSITVWVIRIMEGLSLHPIKYRLVST